MPRVTHVKKARKDNRVVKKGEPYYWWKFRFGGKRYSKSPPKQSPPKRSQLTQSPFLSQLYDLEDTFLFDADNLQESVDDILAQIEELLDMCQESLDNMPEALQDTSESGILLTERIEALEVWASEVEGVDLDGKEAFEELEGISYEGE